MKADRCAACGATENLCFHHLVPRLVGGGDEETNLITLCNLCHAKIHGVDADWHLGKLTSRAMRHMREKGQYTGGNAPYGYTLEAGALVADPFEQDVIAQARELRASGLALLKVSAALTQRGIKARSGRPFAAQQISRMMLAA